MTDSDPLPLVLQTIREIGEIGEIQPEDDFYAAGFTSVRALPLLMELESRFGVTIPDDQFIAARRAVDLSSVIASAKEA